MSDEESTGGGDSGQDLSVPMWVWTLIGFAVVTTVVIIVIIRGGGTEEPVAPDETTDVPAETQPAAGELTEEQSAATQPS